MPKVLIRWSGTQDDMILLSSSPKLKGKARLYGKDYRHFRLLRVKKESVPFAGTERDRSVIKVLEDPGTSHFGKGVRSEGSKILKQLIEKATERYLGK